MKCNKCGNNDIDRFDYNLNLTEGKLQVICLICKHYQDITKVDMDELKKRGMEEENGSEKKV